MSARRVITAVLPVCIWLGACAGGGGVAQAASAGPGWTIRSVASPTNFSAGLTGEGYFITATNVGTAPSSGQVVLSDTLPEGASVAGVPELEQRTLQPGEGAGGGEAGEAIPCTASASTVTCTDSAAVAPGGMIVMHIEVTLTGGFPELPANHAQVHEEAGAGAVTEPSSTAPTPVSETTAGFAVQQFTLQTFGPAGERDQQAGSHPATVLTSIAYDTRLDFQGAEGSAPIPYLSVQEPKIENVNLPMGFLGDALAAPRCPVVALAAEQCPPDTRIGVITVFSSQAVEHDSLLYLYNVTPEAGYPAQFGFADLKTVIMLRPRLLPSQDGYVLSVPVIAPRSELIKLHEVSVELFGDPALMDGGPAGEAFLTNPVSCAPGPLDATLEMNSWEDPGDWQSASTQMFAASDREALSGCGELQFAPTITLTPETTLTDTPSGFQIDASAPQSPNVQGALATAMLRDATLTLPTGLSVSPSAANGLAACEPSGPEGIELGEHDQPDADRLAGEGTIQEGEELGYHGNEDGLVHPAAGHCPPASQVGTVEVTTPLLSEPLKGHVYVAAPECGGSGQPQCTPASAEDGRLFGLYMELAGSGVVVKLHGRVYANPQTGQLSTRFQNAPQLPFSELKLRLTGGQRAPLANPQSCGTFTATTDLTAWSAPFTADATPFSSFQIAGCSGGFAPAFAAGMSTSLHAGSYSPFTLTLGRQDGEGDLSGLTVRMPQGLLGRIAGITECGEGEIAAARANSGGCPASSRVGTATAAAGAGSSPFWQSGPVYLTGPYDGAPFGLAVVVPANAGPYHLGNILVRAAIHIDPATAAVTVVSDPLPQMIDGVPLRLKTVNVTVGNESPFTFNPTDCSVKSINATITSAQGAAAPVSTPFAASGCRSLPFHPSFTASTQGQASKASGASLDVRIATRQGADVKAGEEEANIHKVNVALPIALPSRLTTLQKACLAAVFEANPTSCPEGSFVGTAVAHTPLLPVPLEGPAILVSHGGAAFPDLVIVLQGDGVVIDLTGNTRITKGVTYSKFETAPDAPFSSFELKLPEGPHSVLGAFIPGEQRNFCAVKKTTIKTVMRKVHGRRRKVKVKVKTTKPATLEMPTTITAQNGAVMTQDTKIAVTGCPKAKAAKKKAKTARKAAANVHRSSKARR